MSTGRDPSFFSVKWFLFREQVRVLTRHFSWKWLLIEFLFAFMYFFRNPYRTSRKKIPSNIYGETPLTVLNELAQEVHLQPHHTVLELGAGRGKNCFFLAEKYGCKVIGVEWVGAFVRIASGMKRLLRFQKISFLQQNIVDAPFSGSDLVYIYGTCFSEELIEDLVVRMKELKKGAHILSVSYPISEYDSKNFVLIKELSFNYPWGIANIYLERRI